MPQSSGRQVYSANFRAAKNLVSLSPYLSFIADSSDDDMNTSGRKLVVALETMSAYVVDGKFLCRGGGSDTREPCEQQNR